MKDNFNFLYCFDENYNFQALTSMISRPFSSATLLTMELFPTPGGPHRKTGHFLSRSDPRILVSWEGFMISLSCNYSVSLLGNLSKPVSSFCPNSKMESKY